MKDRKEKNRDKWIRLQGDKWSIKATAIGVPGRDVAISVKLNRTMRQSEMSAARKTINECIQDWFLDSKMLEPYHFIKDVTVPYYNHDREMSSVILCEINVLSRKEFQLGTGPDSFEPSFTCELERLIECLGLD